MQMEKQNPVQKQSPMQTQDEIEVVRHLLPGKKYEATFWTRAEADQAGFIRRYYATAQMGREYVGEYIATLHTGASRDDDSTTYAIFLKEGGQKRRLELDAAGRRAFREVL